MAYEITAETPTEITLTAVVAPRGGLRRVYGAVGLPLFGLSCSLLFMRLEHKADKVNLVAVVLAFFGAIFLLLAQRLKPAKSSGPAAFVFDQRRAGVWLLPAPDPYAYPSDAPATRTLSPALLPTGVFLPFAALSALRVDERLHTSSTSSGSYGRTTYTYHVALYLTDGSTWTLTTADVRAEAEAVLARLRALVARAALAAAPAAPPPVLPAAFALSRQGATAQLRWRNPLTLAEVVRELVGMAVVVGMLGLVGFFIASEPALPRFVFGILALIGAAMGGIVAMRVRQWWRDRHRRYGLDFGPEGVAYLEMDPATGQETHRQAVPLADYYGLSASFEEVLPAATDPEVVLLSRAAHAQLVQRQLADTEGQTIAESLQSMVREAKAKNLAVSFSVKALRPAQRLALVRWAEAEVERLRARR